MKPGRQRGQIATYLGAVVVLLILLRIAWWFVETVIEKEFGTAAGMLWGAGFLVAYLIATAREDATVLRLPLGLLLFVAAGTATLPLSWFSGSKLAVLAIVALQAAACFGAGRPLSKRLRERMLANRAPGTEPLWARQQGDLVADLGRWAVLAVLAFFAVSLAPLLLLLLVSAFADVAQQHVRWTVALWGLAATTFYGLQQSRVRWLSVPACAWIYAAVTAAIVVADLVAGPFTAGTGVQVVYAALPGALAAAFVEVFIYGGGRID